MLGFCGLDCSGCEGFLATQADDDEMRAETAKKWSAMYDTYISAESINCDGCKSEGRKFFYCENLCQIRKCCIEKSLETCAACSSYICDKLQSFIDIAPEAGKALEGLRNQA